MTQHHPTDQPNSNEEMEARLWEFIDGSCNEKEHTLIEQLVRDHAEWKAKYQELLEVHQAISMTEPEHPSMRFTRNVMEEIAKYQIAPAAKQYINSKIIWGIGLFFITMIIGFLIYGIGQINWAAASDSGSSLGVDLGKVDYSRMFNSTYMNMLMMMNVILGLFLLDRYLSNKRSKMIGHH